MFEGKIIKNPQTNKIYAILRIFESGNVILTNGGKRYGTDLRTISNYILVG